MPLPKKWNEAQARAVPILNKFLLANPGSGFAEVAAGVGWNRKMAGRYLQEGRFPFTGAWADKKFYAHGQRPE